MQQPISLFRQCAGLFLISSLFSHHGMTQQDVSVNDSGAPIAPQGLIIPPLPESPVQYDTAEGMDIRVSVFVEGLHHPWSLAFLPDGDMLVTERNSGRLRLIHDEQLDDKPVPGVPEVAGAGTSGLLDIALHPDFSENRYVYLSYNKPIADSQAVAIWRARWNGGSLEDGEDIFIADTGTRGGARMVFGVDGMLYVSVFSNDMAAQDGERHEGKVLRLTDRGDVPPDNPFVNTPGMKPEIFTLGHRSIQGLAVHPGTGAVWGLEMGPNGGDELNILRPGANYGWPLASLGRTYPGPWQSENFQQDGFEDPLIFWMPSISVSGLAFYTADSLPRWQGDIFVGGLRTGQIHGTGHVQRILINRDFEELRREALLVDLRQRIRDVRQGPDGLLYLLTDAEEGAILRIAPAD